MKVERRVKVVNKLGLHARAAAKLVKLVAGYGSQVTLASAERSVDAKSIMGVMMLAATQGTELGLCVEGDDAQAAAEAIDGLFVERFGEGE